MVFAEFNFDFGSPIICTAIHNGHDISDFIEENLALSSDERLQEEDPFTGRFAEISNNRIIVNRSRFEIDLNRTREKCVYLKPEDAWNLQVRKHTFSRKEMKILHLEYDDFYHRIESHLAKSRQKFGSFFVFDIHSFNFQRKKWFDTKVPDIILGTSNMPDCRLELVRNIKSDLEKFDYFGRTLDVRFNWQFPGGNFSRWIHRKFPSSACCVAIEFKKIFMNEITGELFEEHLLKLIEALRSTLPNIRRNLRKLDK